MRPDILFSQVANLSPGTPKHNKEIHAHTKCHKHAGVHSSYRTVWLSILGLAKNCCCKRFVARFKIDSTSSLPSLRDHWNCTGFIISNFLNVQPGCFCQGCSFIDTLLHHHNMWYNMCIGLRRNRTKNQPILKSKDLEEREQPNRFHPSTPTEDVTTVKTVLVWSPSIDCRKRKTQLQLIYVPRAANGKNSLGYIVTTTAVISGTRYNKIP